MITEEQARTLFRVDPGTSLDGRAVLSAARRARARRRVTAAAAVTAATVTAVAVVTAGAAPSTVVRPLVTPTTAAAGVRLDPGQVGNVVALTRYERDGTRFEAVGYFVEREARLSFCTASLGGADAVRHGCLAPARPDMTDVALVSRDPGSLGPDSPTPGESSFGRTLWFAVVSTDVASGWIVDTNGRRHDATVLGKDDPTLPARVLVADLGGEVFESMRVLDARGAFLDERLIPGLEDAIGNRTVVAEYVEDGERHTLYAYFAKSASRDGTEYVSLCLTAVAPSDTDDFACLGPALPGTVGGSPDVGLAGASPGSVENGADSTIGPLGKGWTLTVVSTRVARGVVVDDRGGRHEGTVIGVEDTTLPARFLVADLGDRLFRGVEVYDADGRPLPQDRFATR